MNNFDTVREALKLGGAATNEEIKQALAALAEIERTYNSVTEGQEPVAYLTRTEEGDPAMLFFDRQEAAEYCDGDPPEPLVLGAAPVAQQPQAEAVPDCGEAGHDEGCCGNRDCLPSARKKAPQQAEAVPQWQPIATAPEEDEILAVCSKGFVWIANLSERPAKDGRELTHWMPLPTAPQPKEQT